MAKIAARPFVLKHYEVFFGDTNDYAAAIPSCRFAPQQSVQTWKGGTPTDVYSDISNPTWQIEMRFGSDYEHDESLWSYLNEQAGKQMFVSFKPTRNLGVDTMQVKGLVIVPAVGVGGDIDAWAEETVVFPMIGVPEFFPSGGA